VVRSGETSRVSTRIDSETCRSCGECCRQFPFVELSRAEIDALVAWTGMPPGSFANVKDEAADEFFLRFREDGTCVFLIEEGGSASCAAYEARPRVCRDYPTGPDQDKRCEDNRRSSLPPQSQRLSRLR
jgi:Fe-S-cluster containining protein